MRPTEVSNKTHLHKKKTYNKLYRLKQKAEKSKHKNKYFKCLLIMFNVFNVYFNVFILMFNFKCLFLNVY